MKKLLPMSCAQCVTHVLIQCREGGSNHHLSGGVTVDARLVSLKAGRTLSSDMQPGALKAAYGRQLSFHGGIDMQRLLPHGTPDAVTAEARRYCELLGVGGGYILGPAHLFQPDVPPENTLAVYRA
jgi:uroporphyrinogen-III decarboxylase